MIKNVRYRFTFRIEQIDFFPHPMLEYEFIRKVFRFILQTAID